MKTIDLPTIETPTGLKVDLVNLFNLKRFSDGHSNPQPLVDLDICLAAKEAGLLVKRFAPVLWESQRLKEQRSQTPFYAKRVAKRGAREWLNSSISYQGMV
jgi:hypothetical protein